MTKIFKEMNDICKFSHSKKVILFILKILYFPMSKYLELIFKERISEKVEKFILQANKVYAFFIKINLENSLILESRSKISYSTIKESWLY
jgi:hypothetical protein